MSNVKEKVNDIIEDIINSLNDVPPEPVVEITVKIDLLREVLTDHLRRIT